MHANTMARHPDAIDRLLKLLVLAVVISIVGFAAYYYVDRRPTPQASLMDRAIEMAEKAVRADPQDIIARVAVADLYQSKGRYAEAIGQYQAALEIDAKFLPAHRGLGLVYLEQKQFAEAQAEFQLIVDAKRDGEFAAADRQLQEAQYFLAQALIGQQRPNEAIVSLQGALKIDKTDADAWMLLGSTQLSSGRADDAVASLKRAVLFVPKFADAYRSMAQAYQVLGDSDRAQYAQAMAAYSDGNSEQAIGALQAVTQAQPELWEAWTGLGLAYEARQQTQEATQAYHRALTGNPQDFNARSGLARVGQ